MGLLTFQEDPKAVCNHMTPYHQVTKFQSINYMLYLQDLEANIKMKYAITLLMSPM